MSLDLKASKRFSRFKGDKETFNIMKDAKSLFNTNRPMFQKWLDQINGAIVNSGGVIKDLKFLALIIQNDIIQATARGYFESLYIETFDLLKFLESSEVKSVEYLSASCVDLTPCSPKYEPKYPEMYGKVVMVNHMADESSLLLHVIKFSDDVCAVTIIGASQQEFFTIKSNSGDTSFLNENSFLASRSRIIANLFLYMQAFPEKVTERAPLVVSGEFRGNGKNNYSVGVHEDIIDRSGVRPHFRSGHFRMLSSDKFVNKQGQVVFVRSSFVHGRAKTVHEETPDENAQVPVMVEVNE